MFLYKFLYNYNIRSMFLYMFLYSYSIRQRSHNSILMDSIH